MAVPQPGEAVALQRIATLVELQRWADAADAARTLLASEPDNWRALCLLSQSLSAQGDFRGGLEAAQTAIRFNPDNDWPHRLASIGARCLEDGRGAIIHASDAVRLSPHLAESHRVLTQALMFTGDLNGAARSSLAALELRPDDAANHRLIGLVAYQRDELEASEAAFRRALALEPDDAVSHNELARIALKHSQQRPGGLAKSAEGFARALAADPRQTGSRNNLELVLRVFLSRGAYFLFMAAWIATICEADSPTASPVLGVVVLVVPIGFSWRFIAPLPPQLRSVLWSTIRRDRALGTGVVLEVVTVGAVAVGAIAKWPGLLIGSVLSAMGVWMLVSGKLQFSGRAGQNRRGRS